MNCPKYRYLALIYMMLLLGVFAAADAARPVPQDFKVDKSIGLNMNDLMFQKLSDAIGPIITDFDLSSLIGTKIDLILGAELVINDIDLAYGGPVTGVFEQVPPDDLKVTVDVPKLKLDITVKLLGDIDGDIKAGVTLTSNVDPVMDDFKLGLLASNVSTNIHDLEADLSGIAGAILNFLINTVFPGLIQDFIADEVGNQLTSLLDGSPLYDISVLFGDFLSSAPSFQTSTIDTRLSNNQGHTLSLQAGMYPLVTAYGETLTTTLPNVLPTYGSTTPTTNEPFHLALSISDDILNDILLVVTKTDLFDIIVDGCLLEGSGIPINFDTTFLALLTPEIRQLYPNKLPCHITLKVLKGPVVQMGPGNEAVFFIDDLELKVWITEGGHEIMAFACAVDIKFSITFSIDPQTGELTAQLEIVENTAGEPDVTAFFTDRGVLQTTTEAQIEAGLKAMLAIAGPALPFDDLLSPLFDALNDLEFFGLSPIIREIGFEGPNKDYMSAYVFFDGNIVFSFKDNKSKSVSSEPVDLVAVGNAGNSTLSVYRAFNMEPLEGSPFSLGNVTPKYMTYNPGKGLLYVVGSNGKLGILESGDLSFSHISGSPVNIPSNTPNGLALNLARNQLYILCGSKLDIFNIASNQPTFQRTLNLPGSPAGIAFDPHRTLLYVSDSVGDTLVVYDTSSTVPAMVKTIDLSQFAIGSPGVLAYSLEEDMLYVVDKMSATINALGTANAPMSLELLAVQSTANEVSTMALDYRFDRVYAALNSSDKVMSFKSEDLASLALSAGTTIANPTSLSVHSYNVLYSCDPSGDQLYLLKAETLESVTNTPLQEGNNPKCIYFFNNGPTDMQAPDIGAVDALDDTGDNAGPYVIGADLVEDDEKLGEIYLWYEIDHDGVFYRRNMVYQDCDTFKGEIPGQPNGGEMVYWVEAQDWKQNRTLSDYYSFTVYSPTPSPTPTETPSPTISPTPTDTPPPSETPTSSPTNTPHTGLTSTPTRTPTGAATPTSDVGEPYILMAGYWDTNLNTARSGRLKLIAVVTDRDVDTVEIWFQGAPTGLFLMDNGLVDDFDRGDGIYGFKLLLPPGSPQFKGLFEIIATDQAGHEKGWPYLEVN